MDEDDGLLLTHQISKLFDRMSLFKCFGKHTCEFRFTSHGRRYLVPPTVDAKMDCHDMTPTLKVDTGVDDGFRHHLAMGGWNRSQNPAIPNSALVDAMPIRYLCVHGLLDSSGPMPRTANAGRV